MGKYDRLGLYLRRQKAIELRMTFADIERRIGAFLPKGARRSDWWKTGGPSSTVAVHVRAWRDAGYEAVLERDEEVRFRRSSHVGADAHIEGTAWSG